MLKKVLIQNVHMIYMILYLAFIKKNNKKKSDMIIISDYIITGCYN